MIKFSYRVKGITKSDLFTLAKVDGRHTKTSVISVYSSCII